MKYKILIYSMLVLTLSACTQQNQSGGTNPIEQPSGTPIPVASPTYPPENDLKGELRVSYGLAGKTTQYKKLLVIDETVTETNIREKALLVDKYPGTTQYKLITEVQLPGITGIDSYAPIEGGYNIVDSQFDTMIFTNNGDIMTKSIQSLNPEIEKYTIFGYDSSGKILKNPVEVTLNMEGRGDFGSAKIDATTGKIVPGSLAITRK